MIKIAICDDEAPSRAYLASLIRLQNYPCETTEYASTASLFADKREFDLLFLDIKFSGDVPNGMTLAEMIRAENQIKQPVIIFVTGYDEYVFDAFDVGAFHYLLKPINEKKFSQIFSHAIKQITEIPQAARTLTLQFHGVSRTIPLNKIYYIESNNHKAIFHLKNETFVCYAKIRDLELELQEQFFRIHKGYLVNLTYVEKYSKTELTLTSGEQLLISKYKYRDFVKAYLSFLKKGAGL